VAGSLAVLNAIYGYFILPESLAPSMRSAFSWRRANPLGSLKLLRSHPELSSLALISFLQHISHYVLPSTFVLYVGYRYGWNAKITGLTLALVGVCNVIVQTLLVRRAAAALGEYKMLLIATMAAFCGYFIYASAPVGWGFWLGIPVFAFMGFIGPALQTLMTRRVSASEQGQLQGANSSLMGIAGMFAPLVFTQVFAVFISPAAPVVLPGAPFYLAGLLMVLALFIAIALQRQSVQRAS
jgi:DHA1 family tetracycline resistance protein-like MFS transporter